VREAGMEAGLVTNGGLMVPEVCKTIVETCKFLRVSLDSATTKTHTSIHKPKNLSNDNLDKIIENIKTLVDLRKRAKSDLTIGIAFLVHPLNYLEIYEAANLAKTLGADYRISDQLSLRLDYEHVENTVFLTREFYKRNAFSAGLKIRF